MKEKIVYFLILIRIDWYLDHECSNHMTVEKTIFVNLKFAWRLAIKDRGVEFDLT